MILIILSVLLIWLTLYLFTLECMHFPKHTEIRAVYQLLHKDKISWKQVIVINCSVWVEKVIKLNDYNKEHLATELRNANISSSPEGYIAHIIVTTAFRLLYLIPVYILTQDFFPIFLVLALFLIFNQAYYDFTKPSKLSKKNRELIECDLANFSDMIKQQIKGSNDVLGIVKGFEQVASGAFKHELSITIADMSTNGLVYGLIQLDNRVGSDNLHKIIDGLIGVTRGDDGYLYFQMLTNTLLENEKQKIKKQAEQTKPKIATCIFILFACFAIVILGFGLIVAKIKAQSIIKL